MKNEKLYDEITEIRDDIIEKVDNHQFVKKRLFSHNRTLLFSGIAAVLIITISISSMPQNSKRNFSTEPGTSVVQSETPLTAETTSQQKTTTQAETEPPVISEPVGSYVVSSPQYPEMSQYPSADDSYSADWEEKYAMWEEDFNKQLNQYTGYDKGLESFYINTMQEFLSNTNNNNKIYSPLNVYMALGMLAETTSGNSRKQILDVLGHENIESLRKQATALWNANYCDNGTTTSILASSLWLNENINYNKSTIDTLANAYFAASHQGSMGTEDYNNALRSWLNEQTGGLLSDSINKLEMNPNAVMLLATTIYFQAKWASEFSETSTYSDTFHSPTQDIKCPFMHNKSLSNYYWGEQFSATSLDLENSGEMLIILPDEGIFVEDLLKDTQVTELITSSTEWKNCKQLFVNLSIPKFDSTSGLDLKAGLQNLGITDVFNKSVSDFTPLTNSNAPLAVSSINHDARVLIDEEGCFATAYTVVASEGTAEPTEDIVDFNVNRPFIFVIKGTTGQPLFIGIINQP